MFLEEKFGIGIFAVCVTSGKVKIERTLLQLHLLQLNALAVGVNLVFSKEHWIII